MSENRQPLRLLVLHSQPLAGGLGDLDRLDLARERRELLQALEEGGCAVQVRFEVATPRRTARELAAGLDRRAYQIVLLSAHGAEDGKLVLEDDDGAARLLGTEDYVELFPDASRKPAAVLLCACHSGVVGRGLDQAGIKHVVAVDPDHGVMDSAARVFLVEFILSAARGLPVRECMRLARLAVKHGPAEESPSRFQLLEQQDARHDAPINPDPLPGTVENRTPPLPHVNYHEDENRFVGREAELALVVQALDRHRLVTVTGSPGIGKSHLCREVGRWCVSRRRFPDSVRLVELQSAVGAGALIERIGAAMGFAPVPSGAHELAVRIGGQRALLVLDDFDELLGECAGEVREGLRALLRGTSNLHLLVSSQCAIGGLMEPAAEQVVPLSPLTMDRAIRLFRDSIRDPSIDIGAPEHAAAVEALLQFAGCVPLPVVLAAGQVVEGTTPADLLKQLPQSANQVFSTGPGSPGLEERQGSLAKLLGTAIGRVTRVDPEAERVLHLLSLLPGGSFTERLAKALDRDPTEQLHVLKQAHLVERDVWFEAPRYYLLPPIRLLVEGDVPADEIAEWLPILITGQAAIGNKFASSAGQGHPGRSTATNVELPNLVKLTRLAGAHGRGATTEEALGNLVQSWGALLRVDGRYAEAVQWLELVEGLVRRLNMPSLLLAVTLFYRGVSLKRLPDLDAARSVLQEALQHYQASGEKVAQVQTLVELGSISVRLGHRRQAEQYYERAEMLDSGDSPLATGNLLYDRGEFSALDGDLSAAADYFERAMELYRKADCRGSLANALCRRGRVFAYQERFAEAEQDYRESLAIHRGLSQPLGEANALCWLAETEALQKRLADAEAHCMEALDLAERANDPTGIGHCLLELGKIQVYRKQPEHALELFDLARKMAKQTGIVQNEATAARLHGHALIMLKRIDEALDRLREAAELFDRAGDASDKESVLAVIEGVESIGQTNSGRGEA